MKAERERPTVGVVELFGVFFVIGLTAFGVAVLQSLRTVPVKRQWLRREEIDEGLGGWCSTGDFGPCRATRFE